MNAVYESEASCEGGTGEDSCCQLLAGRSRRPDTYREVATVSTPAAN